MKLRRNKKGFTIIELVIVIAVIGILAAVLIPTFVNLTNKANEAADNALVNNLNKALKMEEQEPGHEKSPTLEGAIKDLEDQGYILENLASKSGKDLLWSQSENQFLLNTDGKSGKDYWKIVDAVPAKADQKYSYYAGKNFNQTDVTVKYGFDAGRNKGIANVTYEGTGTAQEVAIRSSGDQCVLTINAPQDDVNYYGFTKEINVVAVKDESLHIYGSTSKLSVTSGHVQVEDTGIVFELAANTGSVTNNGYIAEQTGGAAPSGTPVSDQYEINSLARLEAFRDVVNSGKNFASKTVKLTANIDLKDGWRPIGEGSRDVAASNTQAFGVTTFFAGTFDGQDHTISGLNNKGFVPTTARLVKDGGVDTFAYGLFALVENATIKNLKLTNVDIDGSRYPSAKVDSVGGLVGYARGNLTIYNVTVSGSIKASDAAAGILGRMYDTAGTGADVSISSCVNNASITTTDKGGKAAGVLAIISSRAASRATVLTVSECSNSGNISSTNATESYAAPIVAYETNKSGATYTISDCSNSGDRKSVV